MRKLHFESTELSLGAKAYPLRFARPPNLEGQLAGAVLAPIVSVSFATSVARSERLLQRKRSLALEVLRPLRPLREIKISM